MTDLGPVGRVGSFRYTHWCLFDDEESAKATVADLPGFATRLLWSDAYDRWLLLAYGEGPVTELVERHEDVKAIVERHGGVYDGGEMGSRGLGIDHSMLTKDWSWS